MANISRAAPVISVARSGWKYRPRVSTLRRVTVKGASGP
jgi:hypothetical protein